MTRKSRLLLTVLVITVLGLVAAAGCGGAGSGSGGDASGKGEDVAAFYKGETITFIVPFNPGGGYDTYARLLAPALEKVTGSTVVVENVPGGGGIKGYNQVYNAKPDGLTIGIFNLIGAIPSQLMQEEGVQFDLNKLSWVARLADDPQVVVASPKSTRIQKFEDLLSAGKVKFASTSTTGSTYIDPMAIIHAFGLTDAQVVTGYEGTNGCDMAVIRGEVDATAASLSSKMNQIKNGDLKALALIYPERLKVLPDVPTLSEMQVDENGKKLLDAVNEMAAVCRSIAAPPGVPEERLQFLQNAVLEALKDPQLLANAEKADSPIVPLDGDELARRITTAMQIPPEFLQELKGTESK